jgi:hypothetical protein
VPINSLQIYFDCNCNVTLSLEEQVLTSEATASVNTSFFQNNNTFYCNVLNKEAASEIL